MDNQYFAGNRSKTMANFQTDINALVSVFLSRSQDLNSKITSETTIGASIVNALIRFVIGPGLEPKASPETAMLGWTDEQRRRFVSQAESFFRLYTGSSSIDYYGREDFGSLQSIALRNIINSGDTLVHGMYGTAKQGFRPMVQVLSGRWVSNDAGTMDTKDCVGGVLLDDAGREVGYQIRQTDDNNMDTFTVRKVRKYNSAGFEEFRLVGIQPHEANQVRGIPWLAPVAQDILDLENFKIAHRVKAATQALMSMVITSDAEAPVQPVSSLDKIRSLENKSASEGPLNGTQGNEAALGAGNIIALNPGERAEMLESRTPMSSYREYMEVELAQIGGAASVPYEMQTQRYTSNYSSSRATIMGAEKTYKVIREELATKFCSYVWNMVVDWGIRKGDIEAPGYVDGTDLQRQAALACTWIGPSPICLDPTREINAHIQAIQNNLEPREVATRERLQMDFDEVSDMLAAEAATLEAKGLATDVRNVFNEKDAEKKEVQEDEDGQD